MDYIKSFVAKLRERYGTSDPFELCGDLDILVLNFDLPTKVRGFFSNISGCKVIYLSFALNENERRMVCAHELGHALLHEKINGIFISSSTLLVPSRYEREADMFAAHLLIEDDEEMFDHCGLSTYEQIAMFTGIDERLVRMRYLP